MRSRSSDSCPQAAGYRPADISVKPRTRRFCASKTTTPAARAIRRPPPAKPRAVASSPRALEATYREAEHTACRWVQPLHIVKHQDNPLPSRHCLEHLEDGKIRSERVRSVSRRIGTQQHYV